jgi:hypothetical protein
MKNKATTNSLYLTVMNDALQNATKKMKPAIIDAIVLFNVRISIIFYREETSLITLAFSIRI